MKRFARTNPTAFDGIKADVVSSVTNKLNELFDKAYLVSMETSNNKTCIYFNILENDNSTCTLVELNPILFKTE